MRPYDDQPDPDQPPEGFTPQPPLPLPETAAPEPAYRRGFPKEDGDYYYQKEQEDRSRVGRQMYQDKLDFEQEAAEVERRYRESNVNILRHLVIDNSNDYERLFWLERSLMNGRDSLTDSNI